MKTTALLAAASVLLVSTLSAASRDYGLQLWSLRDSAKTDIPGTLDKVKGWGIKTVETAGYGSLSVEDYKKLLDERGLKAPSMHAGGDRLDKEMSKVLHEAKVLGVKYIVCPWYPHEGTFDAAKGAKAAADFNRWGKAIKDAGFQFAYHPHGYEFLPTGGAGDERVFDQIVKAVDPKLVKFQLDVFWAYRAGMDPLALLKKHKGQWVSLHLKDLRKGGLRAPSPGVSPSSAPPTDKVIVGEGEIEWPKLLKEADKQGITLGFIEDESLAPVDNIPRSLKYLESIR